MTLTQRTIRVVVASKDKRIQRKRQLSNGFKDFRCVLDGIYAIQQELLTDELTDYYASKFNEKIGDIYECMVPGIDE